MDFVGKLMSFLFNILSRFVTAFLSRSSHLLISPSAVKIKFAAVGQQKSCWRVVMASLPERTSWLIKCKEQCCWIGRCKVLKCLGFLDGSEVKNLPANNTGSIPGLGRSLGEENGYPRQNPCLENLMDRKWKKVKSLSRIRLFATPWTVAHHAPLPMDRGALQIYSSWSHKNLDMT